MTLDAIQRAVFADEARNFEPRPRRGEENCPKNGTPFKGQTQADGRAGAMAAMTDTDSEVLAALTALGYSVVEAQAAIQALPKDAPEETGRTPADGAPIFPMNNGP